MGWWWTWAEGVPCSCPNQDFEKISQGMTEIGWVGNSRREGEGFWQAEMSPEDENRWILNSQPMVPGKSGKVQQEMRAENSERKQRRWSPPAFDNRIKLELHAAPWAFKAFLLMPYLWFLWEDEEVLHRLLEVAQEQDFPSSDTAWSQSVPHAR